MRRVSALPALPAVLAALCASSAGCGGTVAYDHLGMAGATVTIAGGVTTFIGSQYVAPDQPAAGRAVVATGGAMTLAGLAMCVWALDAILRAEARADFGPTDAEWRRQQRRRQRPEP